MNVRVRAIIARGNELLLVKHKDPDGKPYGSWVLPGGKVEEGELIVDAIVREITEETGITPTIGRLLYVHQFSRGEIAEGPEFFFEVTNVGDFENIDLSATSHGLIEIAEIGFYDPTTLTNVLPEFIAELTQVTLPTQTELVIRRQGGSY
jgi:8-oxo-dGTP diphosphatase